MQIALFGGGFDPPHLGHFQVALHILEEKLADEVWFVPVKQHPFGKKMLADELRVSMLRALLEDTTPLLKEKNISPEKIKIELYEIQHHAVSYSFNTLEHFSNVHSNDSFSWIIGSDNLRLFYKWYKSNEMLEKYPVFVYPRPGFPLIPVLAGMIPLQNMPGVDISSTSIREKILLHESIGDFVSPREEKLILENHFYQD